MSGMIRPYVSHLGLWADGSLAMIDTLGNPMPDDTPISVTAGQLKRHLAQAMVEGAELVTKLRDIRTAERAGEVSQKALQVLEAATLAGAQAGAVAGVEAGARYALANTRVRRELERDANGHIVASVESREPLP